MNILIVEANSEMRRLLHGLLEDVAETIFECTNGVEALTACEAHHPELVLMDLTMSAADGLAVTKKIVGSWPSIRVIVIADYDDANLRESARQAGAEEYVMTDNLVELRRTLGEEINM